jgi:hypothetical protein
MLLTPQEAVSFFRLHRAVMLFVNERTRVLTGELAAAADSGNLRTEALQPLRKVLLERLDLLDSFVEQNPAHLTEEELAVVASWRHLVAGKFYIFRELKKYTVFLSAKGPPVAYGVVALTQPFEDLVGPYLPVVVETVLLPFKDRIVYDVVLNKYNISFGAGFRRVLNESYQEAKDHLGIVTCLPAGSAPAPLLPRPKKAGERKARSPADVEPILRSIIGLTDGFCEQHLNGEYAALCRKLAETLARKRPSPLLGGRLQTWACGIVRTIGWANFLDDSSRKPHLKLTAIDQAFGVASNTGSSKSMLIRKMLKIDPFDWTWLLPSQMGDHPSIWIVGVDGFMMDIRHAPREAQVAAFEKGLIPYVPADRENT